METTKNGDLRVWWIPQIPMKPFYVFVKTIAEAKLILKTLADYDTFQYEHNIKPDYSNAGGLEMYDCGNWTEYEDEEGRCIDDID